MSNVRSRDIVFTVCSVNYLTKAVAMCRSVLNKDPNLEAAILIVDRKRPVTLTGSNIKLIWSEDISFPNYLSAAFKYNIIELNTALKPYFAAQMLRRYDKVIYLDPDVYVFGSLGSVLSDLDSHDVILSPHTLSAYTDDCRPGNTDLLRFGAYNLGFFAVRATPAAEALLKWWDLRCRDECWYEPSLGLGVDQKWMDLAPSLFDGVLICKHPGVNVAFWNLHERLIAQDSDGGWTVNGTHPLIFVHFSSFDESDTTAVAGKQTRFAAGSRPDFAMAAIAYTAALGLSANSISASSTEYGYSRMSDGRAISAALRRFYANQLDKRFAGIADPFAADSSVYTFAQKHKLFSTETHPTKHLDFKTEDRLDQQKRILEAGFRFMLRLLGPDRYFMLMRYASHYSSILKQTNVLK